MSEITDLLRELRFELRVLEVLANDMRLAKVALVEHGNRLDDTDAWRVRIVAGIAATGVFLAFVVLLVLVS